MNLKWIEEESMEKGIQKGIQKGKIETFILLYQDGTLDKETCAEKLNLKTEKFEKLLEDNENEIF